MTLARLQHCTAAIVLLSSAVGLAAEPPQDLPSYERVLTAADRAHWAFQPLRRPELPGVAYPSWTRTPVDAFVLAKLDQAGLAPAPAADRRTLLRRVYLDLIGLPPTPEEQRAFLEDPSPAAFARVVDDLLARPQYGERWARHWLDVARYAESNGYERDGAKPHAWRYRDWVIDSLNYDKPFDRFLTEQLAGDEIDGSDAETQIATTFLRLGTWDDEPADEAPDRYDQLDDVLGTTAEAFLGLTLRCARCHNHKFEPFSQGDYYRMLSVFEPLKRPQDGRKDLDRLVGTEEDLTAYRDAMAKVDTNVAAIQRQLDQIRKSIRERLFAAAAEPSSGTKEAAPAGNSDAAPTTGAKRTSLPAEAVVAFQTEADKRTTEQKELVKKFTDKLEQEIREAATGDEKAARERLEREIEAARSAAPQEPPRAYVWFEAGPTAPPTRVLRRGDPYSPLDEVAVGLPAVLAGPVDPPQPTTKSSGRRLWLARWMTRADPAAPGLVARVIVNRIWQHHFGEGLVASENDFGVAGDRPSHPELLDWLAAELIAGGWRLKPIHRLIVLSSVYQQASGAAGAAAASRGNAIDPDNRLLGHWSQRRVDAEVIRDSMLAVSGRLNLHMSGPSVFPPLPQAVLDGQSRPGEGWGKSDESQAARRSVYIFVKRVLAVPELEIMNAPDTTASCAERPVSTIAPQALTFLNGEFTRQQARGFAARLEREAGSDVRAQVEQAFELALCRPPRPEELQASLEFLVTQQRQIEADAQAGKDASNAARQALETFCLVLLNTNEFVYVN